MIYGIGNDIIEIDRIDKALQNENFKERIFSQAEIRNIEKKGNRAESYAGVFSAKESISKAIGLGIRGFKFLEIEILNDEYGKPYPVFSSNLNNLIIEKFGSYQVEVTISHSKRYATAMAIIFRKGEKDRL